MSSSNHIKTKKINWYNLGISLSFLCAIHCLAMPFIIAGLAIAGATLPNHDILEYILLVPAVFIGSGLLWKDYKKHSNNLPLVLFGIGALGIGVSLLTHWHWLSAVGAILFAFAQLANLYWRNKSSVCCQLPH